MASAGIVPQGILKVYKLPLALEHYGVLFSEPDLSNSPVQVDFFPMELNLKVTIGLSRVGGPEKVIFSPLLLGCLWQIRGCKVSDSKMCLQNSLAGSSNHAPIMIESESTPSKMSTCPGWSNAGSAAATSAGFAGVEESSEL